MTATTATLAAIREEYRAGQHRGCPDALTNVVADRLGVGFFEAQEIARQVRQTVYAEAVQGVVGQVRSARAKRAETGGALDGLSPGLRRAAARHERRTGAQAYGGNAKFTAGW